MTLKELFDRCDFTDIATNLKRFYPEQAVAMTRFKEAFDTLRNLEPNLNMEYSCYQAIELSKSYYDEYEKEEGGSDYYISVSCD